jgi:hypothetical protein
MGYGNDSGFQGPLWKKQNQKSKIDMAFLPVILTGGNKNDIYIQKYLYQFTGKRLEQVHQLFQGARF